jgi:hypothetical protein
VSALRSDPPSVTRTTGQTVASVWRAAADAPITDALAQWPPDVFALTEVLLTEAQAFRFALSPPTGQQWPPPEPASWTDAVERAAHEWKAWVEEPAGSPPWLVADELEVLLKGVETPLDEVTQGRDWRLCQALLTLHAIADEACGGLSLAFDYGAGHACLYRAQSRELLARAGSLSRIATCFLRVLPKARTPPTGRASFSRYACVIRRKVQIGWYKLPFRTSGAGAEAERGNVLLLPWPLRVREIDFRAIPGSVRRLEKEPFGFFEFAPSEPLDLDLVDRTLRAAREEVGNVDIVMLPESALEEGEIPELEALLDGHGVASLRAGVRGRSGESDRRSGNWVHIGVNPRLDPSGPLGAGGSQEWFHLRQDKHHRWSLDESQILQYHLGGVLHPHIRWYEAIDTPRPTVQFMETGAGTLTANIVCEDLTQNDEVSEIIRSVGPTFMTAFLLDGPQLASRWGARYASVLADDPGAAVLTLTSYGMARRSRPGRHDPSPVIALWKESDGGAREIPLEPGAHGVLLTVCGDVATRRSADQRRPADTGASIFYVALHQIRAAEAEEQARPARPATTPLPPALDVDDLTILTGWAEAVAETLAYGADKTLPLIAEAGAGASWRGSFGLLEPPAPVAHAIEALERVVESSIQTDSPPMFDAVLAATQAPQPDESALDGLARRVLRSTLDQLRSRRERAAR